MSTFINNGGNLGNQYFKEFVMELDEAEKLAMNSEYAILACEDHNPINSADAAAFFIEGYEYCLKKHNLNNADN